MNITWHGQSCFHIAASLGKNEQVSLAINPFEGALGVRLSALEVDVLLLSNGNYSKDIKSKSFLIEGPGEYEVKNVFVQGISSEGESGKEKRENTIYTIEVEDLKICHLGDFSQKELTEEQLEKIGEIDVLMVPVGGVNDFGAKEAVKVMAQIEPRITIPMTYQIPRLKTKLEGVDKFLKAVGIKNLKPLNKLSVKKKDILPEEAKIIVLEP